MSDVLVILGHADEQSYNAKIATTYQEAMQKEGISVQLLLLGSLHFSPVLEVGYRGKQPLEEDLERAREAIVAARHVVWVYPTWWGHWPALLKGFVDRVFLPGWAFAYREGKALPDKLLYGRSARILTTMDSPWWWYRWVHGRAGHRAMKQATLAFVGFSPIQEGTLYRCRERSAEERVAWLEQIARMAQADAKALKKAAHRGLARPLAQSKTPRNG